jgi:pilus assembly protein CpaB
MNWKAWAPLAVAAVLGLIAAKIALDMTAKNKGAVDPASKLAKVVTAKESIIPGAVLREEDLVLSPLATEQAPAGTFNKTSDLAGRVVTTALVKGQPILDGLLAPQGAGAGLQSFIPEGMRAITIEVNEFSGVAGLLLPGSHVDVLASLNDPTVQTVVSKTIVENVKVTAVGQRVAANQEIKKDESNPNPPPPEPTKSVTLLVTPEQSEAIELASMTGRPRLVLRGNGDKGPANTQGITIAELTGRSIAMGNTRNASTTQPVDQAPVRTVAMNRFAPATQPVEDKYEEHTVEVIRGSASSSVTLKVEKDKKASTAAPVPFIQGVDTESDLGPIEKN